LESWCQRIGILHLLAVWSDDSAHNVQDRSPLDVPHAQDSLKVAALLSRLLLPDVLVPEQCPLPALLVIHDRRGVSQLLELVARHIVEWVVHRFTLEVLELGNPVADVVPVGIAFLGLGEGVEDALGMSASSALG
jgi:hypothetical protein